MSGMDIINWFVPPSVLGDARRTTRHKGIAKSLLAISLATSLMFVGDVLLRGRLPGVEYALFVVAICTPVLGALLIRLTGDISLGLVATNFGGILIVAVWAFFSGGVRSVALPVFLANIALLSTFGNAAILLLMGATLMAALVFLYLATVLGWLPASFVPDAATPALLLVSNLGSVGLVVLAGVVVARERASAKAHLRAAQHAAEQSSRAKSAFLTSISHEFRTPLNAILGFAELLEMDNAKPLSEAQRKSLAHISSAGQYLLGMVSQALEMSRIEAGELKVSCEPLRPDQIVAPCLPMIALDAQKRGISVVDECAARAEWTVWADPVLAKQVLLNLLSNAVKFNRDGGKVTISCAPVAGEAVRISVTDTGFGVPLGRKEELFEPFARLGAEAGSIPGAGLGLIIAKRLAESMQGRIGCESTPGRGSTFWVELPQATAAEG
jgi:signal transduction histidine kinase